MMTEGMVVERGANWRTAAARLRNATAQLTSPGEALYIGLPYRDSTESALTSERNDRYAPFAQVDVTPGFALRTIFASNQFLDDEWKLSPQSVEDMLQLGFSVPHDLDPGDIDAFSWGHYFVREDPPSAQSVALLADILIRGFRDSFGVGDPSTLEFARWLRQDNPHQGRKHPR